MRGPQAESAHEKKGLVFLPVLSQAVASRKGQSVMNKQLDRFLLPLQACMLNYCSSAWRWICIPQTCTEFLILLPRFSILLFRSLTYGIRASHDPNPPPTSKNRGDLGSVSWSAAIGGIVRAHGVAGAWYVSNVSIIFDAPCLFLHHFPTISLHFVAFLCDFRN
jgi:hypothetical protein